MTAAITSGCSNATHDRLCCMTGAVRTDGAFFFLPMDTRGKDPLPKTRMICYDGSRKLIKMYRISVQTVGEGRWSP